MAVYEVSKEKFEAYLDSKIKEHPEYSDLKPELMQFFTGVSDAKPIEDDEGDELWQYLQNDPSQLYLQDTRYHIRLKDTVLDFFENVFFGGLFDVMIGLCTGEVPIGAVSATAQFIFFVKRVAKEFVVKLDDKEYAVYIEMIKHFKEHDEVTVHEVKEWVEREQSNVLYVSELAKTIDKEDVKSIMDDMVEKSVLSKCGDGSYRINY